MTPDTEWEGVLKNLRDLASPYAERLSDTERTTQFILNFNKLDRLLSSRDTYWKEVLQGIYNKGLPTIEQIKQSALGWGKEGSERYEGYIQGAKDVNGLVIWELCSHGIPLNLDGKPPTPITNEDNLR